MNNVPRPWYRSCWDAVREIFKSRNPWEKGPVALATLRITDWIAERVAGCRAFLEFHHRIIGWGASIILLSVLALISLTFCLTSFHAVKWMVVPRTGGPVLPDPEQAQKELADLLARGQFATAREKLHQLQAVWPDDPRYFQAEGAILMTEKHDYAAAGKSFRKALALAPRDVELTYYLAEAEFAMGHYDQAASLYKEVKQSWRGNHLVPFRLYLCASLQGQKEETAAMIEQSSAAFQSPSWFYIRAVEAFRNGNDREARKLIETARLMYGSETPVFDQTLARLKIGPP